MGVLPGAGVGAEGALPCRHDTRGAGTESDLVLLVEDDDTIAGLVTHILVRTRRRVIRARSGAECLQLFVEQDASIGLIILDCRLPDIDGAALCHAIRQRAPNLPILLTSGRDVSRELTTVASGATAFLPKPFRPVDVERKVSSLLGAIR